MLNSTASQIMAATGHRFAAGSTPQEMLDYLISGGWWDFCVSEKTNLTDILAEGREEHEVFGLFTDLEADLANRALAVAYAAHARATGAPEAEAHAVRLWSGADNQAAPDSSPDDLREAYPEWDWTPVAALINETEAVSETRVALILPDGSPGYLVLAVVPDRGPNGIWPHYRTMMFAGIAPEVHEQLALAWSWAVNQDRYTSGCSIYWTVLKGDFPLRAVPDHPIGATAATALSFALGLSKRAKAGTKLETVVLATLQPSGALSPVSAGWTPNTAAQLRKPRVLLADSQKAWAGTDFKITRVATVGEAAKKLRRRRPGLITAAVLVAIALIAGGLTALANQLGDNAERANRQNLTDLLAARAGQSQRPDNAILLALAAAALRPDGVQQQDSLTEALYRDIRLSAVIPAEHGMPNSVALSDTILASGGIDGTITLYDTVRHTTSTTPDTLTRPVQSLTFSADSRWLVAAGGNTVLLRDMTIGQTVWRAELPGAQATAFATDSSTVAIGGADGRIIVHSLSDHSDRYVTNGKAAIRAVALLAKQTLALGGDSKNLAVLDLTTEPPTQRLAIPTQTAITSIGVSPKQNYFTFSEFNGQLRAYSIDTLVPAKEPVSSAPDARLITPPGGGQSQLSATHTVLSIDYPATGTAITADGRVTSSASYPAGGDNLEAVAVSPDGHRLAIPSASGAILLWQPTIRRDLRKVRSVTGAYPVPGTNLILVASGGSALQNASGLILADRTTGEITDLEKFSTPFNAVLSSPLIFDPTSGIAAVRDRDRGLHIYQIRGQKLVKITDIEKERGKITGAEFDTTRHRLLLARGRDITAIPLDQLTAPVEQPVYRHSATVTDILLTPGGEDLALDATDGITVLPLDSGGLVTGNGQRLATQPALLTTISEQGVLATATAAGVVTAYRRTGGSWVGTQLPGHSGRATGLVIADNYVVSSGTDSKVRIFDLRTDRPVVSSTFPIELLPKELWRDGGAVVSSSDMLSPSSVDIVLDPAAAVRRACGLGGWDHTHPRIRDVDPSVPPAYGDITLCTT